MSAWVSVPQHYGFWQLEINRRLQFWCKNLSQCYCSKIPGALKRFICKLLRFLLHRRFCWQNWYYVAQLTLHLFDLEIFFITMPQEARKGKSWGATSMRASKWTLQASVLSVHCLQTNEKRRDKMRIHPHWIPQFHQIFTSSASSKTKMDEKFYCVFVWTRRRAKEMTGTCQCTIRG